MPARFRLAPEILVITLSIPAYFFAYQTKEVRHFGIGHLDSALLADEKSFYPPDRMEGPERFSDGSVVVRDFAARLTKVDAGFTLPYHALRSPVQIDVRCHRFGLEGVVSLQVNGEHIRDFPFAAGSYPWGGIRAVIPEGVASRGPLEIELRTRGGASPPSHLPADLGVGVDFIELTPLSRGVLLVPTWGQWAGLLLLLVLAPFFVRFVGGGTIVSACVLLALGASTVAMTVIEPVLTGYALLFAWLFFPVTAVALRVAELSDPPPRV